ncbi:2'-5' RNA ligase [Jannaschia pagri]|uniref:2'-5' RNA ligase n=1 Tax=Jannaschia pagri TaxID=2829797 RepID=A0ABQ4NG11_9RHOB|nr:MULTISPECIES: RNA ligase family protein [unclassified Jannaschia]GIT90507.1 2'-5' RNA ligase [Jannaschia sp. AI_61]GIT93388.1 2'-5' RNA ligase [Jannaschia sp. AI_62]
MDMPSKKYGRTYHLPTSPGATDDDKTMSDMAHLMSASEIVITEKMDGENTTIHAGGCHPRSLDPRPHRSRDWVKAFAAGISPALDQGERIIGESLFAQHAIAYDALPSYFLGFAVIQSGTVLGWDETLARFEGLGITPVPILHRGPPSVGVIDTTVGSLDLTRQEGLVVRVAGSFPEAQQDRYLGKWVRAGHVATDVHWTKGPLVPNRLA